MKDITFEEMCEMHNKKMKEIASRPYHSIQMGRLVVALKDFDWYRDNFYRVIEDLNKCEKMEDYLKYNQNAKISKDNGIRITDEGFIQYTEDNLSDASITAMIALPNGEMLYHTFIGVSSCLSRVDSDGTYTSLFLD